jgi:hypothetical protein
MNKVTSIDQYICTIENICADWGLLYNTTTHPWFRGQSDASWHLIPKIYRPECNPHYEREMFRDFKLRSSAFLTRIPSLDIEWLFIMQHYGMPTRLLDWTESHLHALYFAVVNARDSNDACVWILDPWSLNQYTIGMITIPSSSVKLFNDYVLPLDSNPLVRWVKGPLPIAVRPLQNTPRIVAQKGTFTIFGRDKQSLDELATKTKRNNAKIRLKRLLVNGSDKHKILKQLILSGVTQSVLFPDLDGLSKEISFRYSEEYFRSIIP